MARAALLNAIEVGISDSSFHKVRDLKIKTKKSLIQSTAEIESLDVDITAKMWENPDDVAEIRKLIDKKYELKRERMKDLVGAFISLKKVLSEEQISKLKGLCSEDRGIEDKKEIFCR